MKRILFFFALVMFAATSYGQGKITFKTEAHDFGKVEEGGPVSFDYVFTNTGNVPVVISNVQPSCGCTTPNWTREPVMPGKTGIVTASFGTAGRTLLAISTCTRCRSLRISDVTFVTTNRRASAVRLAVTVCARQVLSALIWWPKGAQSALPSSGRFGAYSPPWPSRSRQKRFSRSLTL